MQQNSNPVPEFDDAQLERALRRTYEQAQQAEGAERERLMRIGRNIAAERRRRRASSNVDVSGRGVSPLTRMEMAGVDTPAEREAVFRLRYPEGEFYQPSAVGGGREVFRPTPDQPLQYVDPTVSEVARAGGMTLPERNGSMLENLGRSYRAVLGEYPAAGRVLGEIGLEAFDVLGGDAPALGLEAAALAGLRATPGGRVLSMARPVTVGALAGMGGASAGGAFEQGLQYVRGTQRQTPLEQSRTVSLETALGGAGGFIGGSLGSAGGRSRAAIEDRGLTRTTDEQRQAVESFGSLAQGRRAEAGTGELGLLPSQVSDSEVLRALTSAASRIFPRISRYQQEQRDLLLERLGDLASASDVDAARSSVLGQYEQLLGSYRADLRSIMGQTGLDQRQGGQALVAGRELFERESGEVVRGLYDHARSLGPVQFNIRGDTVDGVESLIDRANAAYAQASRPVQQIDPRTGETVMQSAMGPAERREAEAVLSQIEQLPDNATVDDLRNLASRLYDASQPGPEGARASHALARSIRAEILNTIENPVSGAPEAIQAYRAAANAARERFSALELGDIVALARSGNDQQFYAAYRTATDPSVGGVDRLTNIRDVLTSTEGGRQKWNAFRESFRGDLSEDVGALPQRLARYQETDEGRRMLDMLLSPQQRNQIDTLAARVERLQSTRIEQVAQAEETSRVFADRVMNASTPTGRVEAMREFLEASGGEQWKSSAAGRAVRAGIIEHFMRNAIGLRQGGERFINPARLRKELNNYRQRGLLQFLNESDIETLRNIDNVTFFVEAIGADVGTSLVARQEVNQLFNNPNVLKTIASLAPYMTFGRMMTSESIQRALRGEARRAQPSDYLTQRFLFSLTDDLAVQDEEEYEILQNLEGLFSRERAQQYLGADVTAL